MLPSPDTNFNIKLNLLQGAELEVLKTINLARVNISVLVVEMDGSNSGKDDAVRKLLVANNFELDVSMKEVKAGLRNEWYVSKDFSPPKVCILYRLEMCMLS